MNPTRLLLPNDEKLIATALKIVNWLPVHTKITEQWAGWVCVELDSTQRYKNGELE